MKHDPRSPWYRSHAMEEQDFSYMDGVVVDTFKLAYEEQIRNTRDAHDRARRQVLLAFFGMQPWAEHSLPQLAETRLEQYASGESGDTTALNLVAVQWLRALLREARRTAVSNRRVRNDCPSRPVRRRFVAGEKERCEEDA